MEMKIEGWVCEGKGGWFASSGDED
jgi:hypothetical protein